MATDTGMVVVTVPNEFAITTLLEPGPTELTVNVAGFVPASETVATFGFGVERMKKVCEKFVSLMLIDFDCGRPPKSADDGLATMGPGVITLTVTLATAAPGAPETVKLVEPAPVD